MLTQGAKLRSIQMPFCSLIVVSVHMVHKEC